MKEKYDIQDRLIITYIFVSLFMFAFINTNSATIFQDIVIPYISFPVVILHFAFSMCFFAFYIIYLIVSKKKIKINFVMAFLFLKCIFDLISYFSGIKYNSSLFIEKYLISVSIFIAFFICSQAKKIYSIVKIIFIGFAITISIQTILTFFLIDVSYTSLYYKSYMVIPYGGTNIIASILIPLILIVIEKKKNNKLIYVLYSVLLLIAIFLCKSRGGVIMATIALVMMIIRKKNAITIMSLFFIIPISLFFALSNEAIRQFLMGYAGGNASLNDITTGRLEMMGDSLKLVYEKFFFGHGLGATIFNENGSHNLFIDLLYQTGVVGFTIYISAIACVIVETIRNKKNRSFLFLSIILILINSMFEVCYFSYKCDTIFWIMCGVLVSLNNDSSNKQQNQKEIVNVG